jgi:hypothetical protein
MIKNIRLTIGGVHLVNGLSAMLTGWLLIKNPSGGIFDLSLDWVSGTPMKDYALIGMIWFVFNGLVGVLLAGLTFGKNKFYADLAIIQGGLLAGWLVLAIIFVKQFVWMWHIPYFAIAGVLVFLGIKALNREKE